MSIYKSLYTNQKKIFTETNACKQKEMFNILCSEIRLYFMDFMDNNIILTIIAPIKIDGITVYVCISKNNEGMYTYMLETINAKLYDNTIRSRIVVFTSDNNFENLIELFDELNVIKNTYVFVECNFTSPDSYEYNFISPKQYEFYIENPELYCFQKTEMCSVCFENTCVYTLCKHPLCFKCRDTLAEQKNQNCPVCHQNNVDIVYIEEEDQEEIDDDDEYEDMEMLDLNTFLDNTLVEDTVIYLKRKNNNK